ncbi:(6-4) photolyase [Enterobacterales bacterium 8AC]|nr:(6-4) photolyase [Enterobacterales bacterium 8AC]
MTELRLILGDQLNPEHSWFRQQSDHIVYVMLELQQETRYVCHHAQKIIAIFAAMREFARQLREQGHRVRYVQLDDPSNRGSLTDNLDALIAYYQAVTFSWQLPDEWRLDEQLKRWSATCAIKTITVDSEHFFCERHEVSAFFGQRKSWRMEHFYREMRRRERVLMRPDATPEGGEWNYDAENRKPWKGHPAPPDDHRPMHNHTALWHTLTALEVPSFGEAHAGDFRWPLDRKEALGGLERFVRDDLRHFGDWQDAMHTDSWHLFHSLISFALNTKMLSPREVVANVQAAWQRGEVPLACAEGFIRQVLGWREYVRGVYWAKMPGYRDNNFFHHQRPLPDWFWNGNTKMNCMAQVIGQSLDHAYAHHIQRLMIVGNFALLAGLAPAQVHEWYLGIYIDAFEWVELPNTLGMSQFTDGGLLASKPYVSSAAYINKMSNYCSQCKYNPRERTGENACPFNALYWHFFIQHQSALGHNPRLSMVYHQIKKFSPQEHENITQHVKNLLIDIEKL